MAVVRRIVETRFWQDPEVIENFSVEDKYFLLYLMTNPATTQVGIYQLSKRTMSFECGYTTDVINVLLDRFENKYHCIIYSEETQELSLVNSLTYSIVKGGKPVSDLLQRELSRVKDGDLILMTYNCMIDFWQKSDRPFDTTVKRIFEHELTKRQLIANPLIESYMNNDIDIYNKNKNDIDNNIHNDNEINNNDIDNDNEDSTHDSFLGYQLNKVKTYYTKYIGKLTQSDISTLTQWLTYLTADRVIEALDKSRGTEFPIKYAQAILNNRK